MECKYIHHTYQVNGVQQNTLGHNDVLLDTHANISIVHPDLWWDVQRADHEVKINGVKGHQFSVNLVYASEKTQANVLSLSEVEDR